MFLLEYIPLLLLIALLWHLARRSTHRTFPWFFTYVVFAIFADLARFLSRGSWHAYFVLYWCTEAGYGVLGLLALYEVMRKVLIRLEATWWFRTVTTALIIASILLVFIHMRHTPPNTTVPIVQAIIGFELLLRLLQTMLLLALLALVLLFGLRWRQQAFGIGAGFGLYATVDLVATREFSRFGTKFALWWGIVQLVAYTMAVLIWIYFFWVPEAAQPEISPEKLQVWSEELLWYRRMLDRMRKR
jgi:hypothetical protein